MTTHEKLGLVTVVVATKNQGKLGELATLLGDLPIELKSPKQVLGEHLTVHEDGETFEENAILKARAACQATGLVSLADDSGLEVDALAGRPGVRSARFAGDDATDAQNNAALLQELAGIEEPERGAQFRCILALATPWSPNPVITVGTCKGSILRAPRGTGGFGYDPLFLVDGCDGRTMAELSPEEKNEISHRGRATRAMVTHLSELLQKMVAPPFVRPQVS